VLFLDESKWARKLCQRNRSKKVIWYGSSSGSVPFKGK